MRLRLCSIFLSIVAASVGSEVVARRRFHSLFAARAYLMMVSTTPWRTTGRFSSSSGSWRARVLMSFRKPMSMKVVHMRLATMER